MLNGAQADGVAVIDPPIAYERVEVLKSCSRLIASRHVDGGGKCFLRARLTRSAPAVNLFDIKCAWFNEEEYCQFFSRTLFAAFARG